MMSLRTRGPGRRVLTLAGTAVALALALAVGPAHAQGEVPAEPDAAGAEEEAPPPIVVSEAEAKVCAARLEPMISIAEDSGKTIYLRRLSETAFQVWAPRLSGPQAPLEPWCVTTLDAISEISFIEAHTRAVVMGLVASAREQPPPAPDGVEPSQQATDAVPEVIVEGEDDEEEARGLPAAFQRLPPKGGRSAPTLGLPVPVTSALSLIARADVDACRGEGGQATVVVDRYTGKMVEVACWLPDGTAGPLPSLAADLARRFP